VKSARSFIVLASIVLAVSVIGCDEQSNQTSTTAPAPIPDAPAPTVDPEDRVEPEYTLKLTNSGPEWTATVNTGGWTMKTDSSKVEKINDRETARIYITIEAPSPDDMVTQAFQKLTGETSMSDTKIESAELWVKRLVRGQTPETEASYVLVKRAPE